MTGRTQGYDGTRQGGNTPGQECIKTGWDFMRVKVLIDKKRD